MNGLVLKGAPLTSDNLIGISQAGLESLVESSGHPRFRGRQLFKWLYQKKASDFSKMTDLSAAFRSTLASSFTLELPTIKDVHNSDDGTRKLLLSLHDGKTIESVLIPSQSDESEKRLTLCISSQVGCAMGCKFCATARQGLERNLTSAEIVGQYMRADEYLKSLVETGALPRNFREKITNIVFMGMGEPFHNFDNVMEALRVLVDESGINLSKRKITVSTVGLAPEIEMFAKVEPEIRVNLAVSLNGFDDQVRSETMPINDKYPLKRLIEALSTLPLDGKRRITFEYVLMAGVNDGIEDAKKLAKLVRKVPSKVNLIPYNEFPGSPYKKPAVKDFLKYQRTLLNLGIATTIRYSKGPDILAACGMLKTSDKNERLKKARN